MSSGTRVGSVRGLVESVGSKEMQAAGNAANLGMSPRQAELNRLWAYYRCCTYDGRKADWNGLEQLDHVEHDMVATQGYLPPGYYDAGQNLPLKFRRPTAPFYLGRVIVDRFTGLLFSERRHPKIFVEGDNDTQEWLAQFAKSTRLWQRMIQARTYGGACGSVAMSFKFLKGKPYVEVHDPRWCEPTIADRATGEVESLEIRYMYPKTFRDENGQWIEGWFWYRRIIDTKADTVWPQVPVDDGAEPNWDEWAFNQVAHNLGFCPVVWIQNKPVQDDLDGDPDAHGCFDLIEAVDALYAQANRGIISNCDPTLTIASDGELGDIAKGTGNAIKLEAGGSAQYMEITGTGPEAALKLAERFEDRALMLARCVLDDPGAGGQAKTATEVDRRYSGMFEEADIRREQYGEEGIRRLLEMVLRAARQLDTTKVGMNEEGLPQIVRQVVKLPPKVIPGEGGFSAQFVEHKLGPSDSVELRWPPYFEPSLEDTQLAVAAAGAAKQFTLIDAESATQFVAPHFRIEDVPAVLARVEKMEEESAEQLKAQVMGRLMGGNQFGRDKAAGGEE